MSPPPQPSRSTFQTLILFAAWVYSSVWAWVGYLGSALYWILGGEEDNLLGPAGESPSYSDSYSYDHDLDPARAGAWRGRNSTTTRRGPVNGKHLTFSGWVDRVMAMENREDHQEEEEEEEEDYYHHHHQPKNNQCVGLSKQLKSALVDLPSGSSYGTNNHNILYHSYSHAGLLYHLHAAVVEKLMAKPTKMLPIPRLFVEKTPDPNCGSRTYFYCRSGRYSTWEKNFSDPLLNFMEKTFAQGFHHGNGVDLLGELVAVLRFLSFSLSEIPDLVLDLLRTGRQHGLPISEYKKRERLFDAKWIQSTMYQSNPDFAKYTDDSIPMPNVIETRFECEDKPYEFPIGRTLGYQKSSKLSTKPKGTGADMAVRFASWDVPTVWCAPMFTTKLVEGRRVNTAEDHLSNLTADFQKILGDKPFQPDVKNLWIAHCFWSQK